MSDEKKINKSVQYIISWMKTIERNEKALEKESKPKKVEKLNKEITHGKERIRENIYAIIENGGEPKNYLTNLSEYQQGLIDELFCYGLHEDEVEASKKNLELEKEIQRIKKMLHEDLKEAMEKYSYDPEEPIETRRESKLYKVEAEIGQTLLNAGDETLKDSLLFKNDYRECWNYTRDYEATKDEYFTKEEQALMEHCVAIRMEDEKYRIEKNAFWYNLGTSLIESADKIGEWGDITQAKIWAKNLYQDVFPVTIEKLEGKLSKEEMEKKSKEMTKRYIQFIDDEDEVAKMLQVIKESQEEAALQLKEWKSAVPTSSNLLSVFAGHEMKKVIKTAEDEIEGIDNLTTLILVEKLGVEKAGFALVYSFDKLRDNRKELLRKYTFEELGL